ncbi:hypothetical protein F0562_012738 [Nyssa sinensis]|uniref:Uncharacterized protein n=1 Tax=Nyssa sinensis TaxID=561372 RepID=A0A5J4ZV90_9ASTE|nr:hypothetical protein F0562_012738 [Nyssa sinensis]
MVQMVILSVLLSVLFTWTLVQGLISITKGSKTNPDRLPPGPTPLPVIRNLLKLGNKPHKALAELAKTHGPIMMLELRRLTTVVISSPTMELVAHIGESCKAGVAIDIGQAAFRTSLNLLSNTIFSMDLADPNSDMAQELKEVMCSIMEEAGKPNLVDYFPMLQKMDLQGIRRRLTIHFGRIIELLEGMINQRLELKKVYGYIPSNDVLDTLLNITEDENQNDGIDRIHIENSLLVQKY